MEKSTLDEYSSIKYFYDQLVGDRELFEIKALEMDDEQVIDMYKYLAAKLDEEEANDNLLYAVSYLEEVDAVQCYLYGDFNEKEISREEQKEIDEIVQRLEKKRNPSLINRFVNYFKK